MHSSTLHFAELLVVSCCVSCSILISGCGTERDDTGKEWDRDFKDYTIQCSHNTYLYGRQSAGTAEAKFSCDVKAVTNALNLGYRCIELDVWKSRTSETLKVKHSGVTPIGGRWDMSNGVELHHFVKAITDWYEEDENTHPLTTKLPLVISVENHAGSLEDQMASLFETSFKTPDDLGTRIISPEEFRPGVKMKALLGRGALIPGQGPKPYRKIIIKSSSNTDAFKKIVAMPGLPKNEPKPLQPRDPLAPFHSKSLTSDEMTEAKEYRQNGDLVRIYPPSTTSFFGSMNFPFNEFLEEKMQMVCVNVQGHCPLGGYFCSSPTKGTCPAATSSCHRRVQDGPNTCTLPVRNTCHCDCARDGAAAVEVIFDKLGYDGYILIEGMSQKDKTWLGQLTASYPSVASMEFA